MVLPALFAAKYYFFIGRRSVRYRTNQLSWVQNRPEE